MNQFQDLSQDFTKTVPTFRESSLLEEAGISKRGSNNKQEDAFLFYSNDEVRMRVLSGGTRGAAHLSSVTDGVARKTRISFELHPSVFFEEFFEELVSDEAFANGVIEHVTEEEEDAAAAMAESPKMERVVSINFGGRNVKSNISTSRAA